jgi:hypothetical protein
MEDSRMPKRVNFATKCIYMPIISSVHSVFRLAFEMKTGSVLCEVGTEDFYLSKSLGYAQNKPEITPNTPKRKQNLSFDV